MVALMTMATRMLSFSTPLYVLKSGWGPQWLWPSACYHSLPHCMYHSPDGDPNDPDHQHTIIHYPIACTTFWVGTPMTMTTSMLSFTTLLYVLQSGYGPQWLWPPVCYHPLPYCMYYSLDGDPNDYDHLHAIILYPIVCMTVWMGALMTMTTSMLSFTTLLYLLQSG